MNRRRRLMAAACAGLGLGATVLAGCSPGTDETDDAAGGYVTIISSQESAATRAPDGYTVPANTPAPMEYTAGSDGQITAIPSRHTVSRADLSVYVTRDSETATLEGSCTPDATVRLTLTGQTVAQRVTTHRAGHDGSFVLPVTAAEVLAFDEASVQCETRSASGALTLRTMGTPASL